MILTSQILCLGILVIYGWISFRKDPLRLDIRAMAQISILLVAALILSYFSVMVGAFGFPSLKIGISQVPLILIGVLYGPSRGLIAGLVYDVLGLIVTPTDMPFLGFTLVNVLVCSLPGWIMKYSKFRSYGKVKWTVVGVTAAAAAGLIAAMWIMKENFPFALADTERIAVTVLAALYPFLMWGVFFLIEKTSSAVTADVGLLLAVLAVDAGINLFLNPLWLQIMYGIPYAASFVLRVLKLLIVVPVDYILVTVLYKVGRRFRKG